MTNYVMVGNSVAAHSAAMRIKSLDPEGRITFISDEDCPYFSRCALMYFVMDWSWERDIYIADPEHYRRLNSTLVFDTVTGVDVDGHELKLKSGDTIPYDKLLIASGAMPRQLGLDNEDARGVYDFTTIYHARQLLEETKRARHAVVIGGGLIGAEVAEAFSFLKIPVDYLVREPIFYQIFCSEEQSRIIIDRFERHGVRMRMKRGVGQLEKDDDGRVVAVIDSEGDRYETDVVVRAIGVDPCIWFLEGSGVQCETGVLVNDRLRNAAPDVWAAGDCAEIKFPGQERTAIQKLWYTSQPQGWIAGENMAGGDAIYEPPPSYQAAMFLDLDFTSYGEMPAPWNEFQEQTVVAPNGVDAIRFVHDGEHVAGASFLGKALVKEDIEHMVVSSMGLGEAIDAARLAFGEGKREKDRAPVPQLAQPRRLSRRPLFWPFKSRRAR